MAEEPSNPRTEVDDQQLGRILRCEPQTIRTYVRVGVLKRGKNKKFPLFQSIGDVVDYLRAMAGRQGTGDAMKAGAALKDVQRRLTETKLAKLDGQLLSMPEAEAIWSDLVAAAKWLFLALPARSRMAMGSDTITPAIEQGLSQVCATMLKEVALTGQMQLPTGKKDLDDDDDLPDPELPAA